MYSSLIRSPSSEVVFYLKVLSLRLRHNLRVFSLLPGPSDASSSLKEKVLTQKFDLSGSRARLCACSLLPGSLGASFSLKEKVLTWSIDLRGQGHVYVLVLFTRGL